MNLLKHLPQFQWPFRSTADRYAKDYLAEERSGSGQDDRQPWALTFSEWVSLFSGVKHLEERVSALEEGADSQNSAQNVLLNWLLKVDRRVELLKAARPSTDSSPDTETQADPLSGSDTSSKSLSHVSLDGKPTPLVQRGTSGSRSSPRNLGSKRAPSRAARTGRTPTVRA